MNESETKKKIKGEVGKNTAWLLFMGIALIVLGTAGLYMTGTLTLVSILYFGFLVIAGGVGANLSLRQTLQSAGKKYGWKVSYPRLEFCTDNGAMIAFAGCQRLMAGQQTGPVLQAFARWPLDQLPPLASQTL